MSRRRFCVLAALVPLSFACRNLEDRQNKVLIGATLLDGAGAPPVSDAVVVIQGAAIVRAGTRAATPIPQDSERTDVTGLFVAPVNLPDLAPGAVQQQLEKWSRSPLPPRETFLQATSGASAVPGRPATLVVLGADPTLSNAAWGQLREVLGRGRWIR